MGIVPFPTMGAALAIVLVSAMAQGATGFGFAVLAVPMLMLVEEVRSAVVVVTMLGFVASVGIVAMERSRMDWRSLVIWAAGAALGLPGGILAFTVLSQRALSRVTGMAIGLVVVALLGGVRMAEVPRRLGGIAGVASGLLAGAVGMSGPPIALYATWIRYPKDAFRATIAALAVSTSGASLIGYAAVGRVDSQDLLLSSLLLPGLLAGLGIGFVLHPRLSQRAFDRVLLVLLAGLSIRLIMR